MTYLELFLDFLEIQEITEILEILEIRAQICLNVSRMMQGVIGATPPGGFGGAEAPPRCRPPSFLVVMMMMMMMMIQVMRTKTPAGGDDGWWEGEVGGRAGLFPSLVVEPLLDTKLGVHTTLGPQEKLEIVEPELGAMSKPLSPVKLQFERKSKLRSPASSRKSDKEFPLCGPTDLKSEGEKGKTGYIPKLKPPPPYSVVVTPATPGAPAPPHTR